MISLCCFSKNRPMQLRAFLESCIENAPYISDITVLYTYDDNRFIPGYEKLKTEFRRVYFIEEKCKDREEWRNLIITLVSSFGDYFLWSTDDSLFYRKVDLTSDMLDWAFNKQKAKSINLRIGQNIKWQNHWHSERTPDIPVQWIDGRGLMTWDSSNISVQNDVGRLWQNDASIMPRDEYLNRLCQETHWHQGRGCRGLDNVAQSGSIFNPRIGCCFVESVYLNFPVNLVHVLDDGRLYADNWGRFIQQDIFSLQDKFDQGYKIDWKAIDFSNVDCGRKEVEYTFIK